MNKSTLFRRYFATVAFVSAFALAGSALQAQNLVADPGFEASLDGSGAHPFSPAWTIVDTTSPNPPGTTGSNSNVGGSLLQAHSGDNYANLGAFGATGSLSQVLSTTAGQSYELSFWLANNGTAPPNLFAVYWGGTQIYSASDLTPFSYTQSTFDNLVASGTSTTLEFQYQNDDDFFRLDDISVSAMAVPEVSTTSFVVIGCGLLGFVYFRRKRLSRFGIGL